MWRLLLNPMTKTDRKTDNFILPVYKHRIFNNSEIKYNMMRETPLKI